MKSWFLVREYAKDLIEDEMKKSQVYVKNRNTMRGKSLKAVTLVMDYDHLYMYNEFEEVFTPKPMILFRNVRKLSSYLAKAKLYPTERTVESHKCGVKRCEVC